MKINSILAFIEDIKKSLQNNCYYSALTLALTLPDICGKVMYPEIKGVGERYIKWFNTYIGNYEQSPLSKEDDNWKDLPYLNGEICYNLRCALLHQGENDLQNRDIKSVSLDEFTLIIETQNEFEIYCDSSSKSNSGHKALKIQIRNLCNKIIWSVEAAMERNEIKIENIPYLNVDIRNIK